MLKKLVSLLLVLVCCQTMALAAGRHFTLVIDAGHGGRDAGAVGTVSKEKNINLSVALAFGRYVEMNCPSVKVIYTRKTDVFVPLQERANIANRNKADLFMSIHTNSLAKGKAKGFETYTLGMHVVGENLDVAKRENSVITMESDYRSRYQGFDPNSAESYIMFEYLQDKNMENSVNLAKFIQSSVCRSASRINKGVHQAGFLVLRETSMPSCLIELGFISTPEEERQLNDPTVQDQMARGLYQAFARYLDKYGNGVKAGALAPLNEEPKVEPRAEVQPRQELQPVVVPRRESQSRRPETVSRTAEMPSVAHQVTNTGMPVFKVQILVGGARRLRANDRSFKGLTDIDAYKENGMYKYTYGATTSYNEALRLRKSILSKFPEAFIIAFKDDAKMNVNEAIREWKAKR